MKLRKKTKYDPLKAEENPRRPLIMYQPEIMLAIQLASVLNLHVADSVMIQEVLLATVL